MGRDVQRCQSQAEHAKIEIKANRTLDRGSEKAKKEHQ